MKDHVSIEAIVINALKALVESEGLKVDITRASIMADALGVASTELVFILLEIENQTAQALKDIDYGRISTVGDLIDAAQEAAGV